jgi:hypothetical protein
MTEPQTAKPNKARVPDWTIWGIAAVLYFLLAFKFMRILALDYEALIFNLNQSKVGPSSGSRLLILFGAFPLFTLIAAAVLFRVRKLLAGTANPLAQLSAGIKFALASIALVPFFAFLIPASKALAVWTSIEAFWWIEWYDSIDPMMEAIGETGPMIFGLAATLIALGSTWWALTRVSPEAGKARKLLRFVVMTLTGVLLISFLGTIALHGKRVLASSPEIGLFESTCNQCHPRSRPLYFIKTPAEWRRTVTRMQQLEKAPLTDEQVEAMVSFLSGMRSFSDSWTTTTRCGRCHGFSPGFEERRPEDWRVITQRLATYSPYYYRQDIRDQLVTHLTEAHGDPTATLGLDAATYQRFMALGQSCTSCHGLSREADRYRERSEAELIALVKRMSTKMTAPLEPGKIEAAARTYRELMSEPARFDRLFPHDQPVKLGAGEAAQ